MKYVANARVYIAGPMRGYKHFNFPAFDFAASVARARGYDPISPADMDREAGFDATKDSLEGFDLQAAIKRDVDAIMSLDVKAGDAIAMLPGWEQSVGAMAEHALARMRGLRILDARTFGDFASAPAGELRQTDPSTGAQKGAKPEAFALLPAESLEDIARVYDFGSKKYAAHNWRGGYPWSWSFNGLMRHLWAFWRGEDIDPESGLPHLAHAGFHVLTLLWYSRFRGEKDDRWKATA